MRLSRNAVLTMVAIKFHLANSDADKNEHANHNRVFQCKAEQAHEELPKGGEEAANGHCLS